MEKYVNMADINRPVRPAPEPARQGGEGDVGHAEAQLAQTIELMFFAYRDFTSDPDAILAERGFGRAHHRVLHFVSRYPGLRVADLLEILKITKQSLARVLKQLIEEGFIEQRSGPVDRRERLLYTTAQGAATKFWTSNRSSSSVSSSGPSLSFSGQRHTPSWRPFRSTITLCAR